VQIFLSAQPELKGLEQNQIRSGRFGTRALRPICSIHEIIELLLNPADVGFCALEIRP
jgi:hypothetical protein